MEIILHLGGNPERAKAAAQLAVAHPNAIVVVSSEGTGFMQWYEAAGIVPNRIIVDEEAWDTVTNFSHTYSLLKRLGCSRLFVVTNLFHSYRASLIAFACWGGRVPIYFVSHSFDILPDDEKIAFLDCFRALCWRVTGILFFFRKVREQRQPDYKTSTDHARIEIGI